MAEEATIYELSSDREALHHDLPPLEDVGETATRILQAGLDLFAARGYHATSIRDIAAGAGLQSASGARPWVCSGREPAPHIPRGVAGGTSVAANGVAEPAAYSSPPAWEPA